MSETSEREVRGGQVVAAYDVLGREEYVFAMDEDRVALYKHSPSSAIGRGERLFMPRWAFDYLVKRLGYVK